MQSPNFPDEYDNNVLCKNLIKAPVGYQAQLNFTHFELDDDENCQYDSLKVYDGPDESSQLLGTYCGNELPRIIQSYGRYLYVVFTSDKKVTYSGYRATVSFAGMHAILAIYKSCLSSQQTAGVHSKPRESYCISTPTIWVLQRNRLSSSKSWY